MFQDDIIYSDENEDYILRLSDIKPSIEERVGLPVRRIHIGSKEERVEYSLAQYREKYGQEPLAWWWGLTFYDDPGGIKDGMVNICLFPDHSIVIHSYEHPRYLRMNEEHRNRAKEHIPTLTLEYIEALEEICIMGEQLYKTMFELSKQEPDLRGRLNFFHTKFLRVGFLGRDYNSEASYQERIQKL